MTSTSNAPALSRPSAGARVGASAVASLALAWGLVIALHHPIAPALVAGGLLAWSAAVFQRPSAWLLLIPAALPIIDMAPWTGWISLEEFDLLVLGAAAGGYARIAAHPVTPGRDSSGDPPPRFGLWIAVLFGASTAIALRRGIDASGGLAFDWYGGYYDAMNSLRVFKGYAHAALMWPLLLYLSRQPSSTPPVDVLCRGATLGCVIAAASVIWERAAFTGLLDFSSDYRATGMFWETHVGGAALDGYLSLTLPFAVGTWVRSRTMLQKSLALCSTALIAYACLTTFSRGLYAAVSVSLIVFFVLEGSKSRNANGVARRNPFALFRSAFAVCCAVGALWITFRVGGYRSLVAAMVVIALSLRFAGAARGVPVARWRNVAAGGGVMALIITAAALPFPNGPYWVFALFTAASLTAAWGNGRYGGNSWLRAEATLLTATVVSAMGIPLYWATFGTGLLAATAIAGLCLLIIHEVRRGAISARGLREQVNCFAFFAVIATAIAVLGGGAYMSSRLEMTEKDFETRTKHWHNGLAMLHTWGDWALGAGLGRFPVTYFYNAESTEVPGSYAIDRSESPFAVLSGPRHATGFGELFRLSQRVSITTSKDYAVRLLVTTARDVTLHAEVCEKHLLYSRACALGAMDVPGAQFRQAVVIPLSGAEISRGSWYAPRLAFFSIAIASPGTRVGIHDVLLEDDHGTNLIENGNFHAGMRRWFFTSDRDHLPWHIKNLALDVLFDQGMIGIVLFTALAACALFRVIRLAPRVASASSTASALIGFWIVGLFDSLLDVPRVAFLYYLLLLVCLSIREPRRGPVRVLNEGVRDSIHPT